MSDLSVGDATMATIYQAMEGLSARQQAISTNVANANTPGFHAKVVDFETSLANATATGDPASATVSVTDSTAPGDATGNNVDLGGQEITAAKTSLAFQTMVQAMNAKFSLLSTAISGQPSVV